MFSFTAARGLTVLRRGGSAAAGLPGPVRELDHALGLQGGHACQILFGHAR